MKIFKAFKTSKELVKETEYLKIYNGKAAYYERR